MNHENYATSLPFPSTSPYRAASGSRRKTPVPDEIGRIHVPLGVLEQTSRIMRAFGKEDRECYLWWGGYFTGASHAQVVTAYCPDVPTDFGRVSLNRKQLHSMHKALRDRDQVLLVELHTHPPGAGGQNEVDAENAAAPYPGFITIVVPDFAAPYLHDIRRCHVYQYLEANRWEELDHDRIGEKFVIEESLVLV